ncbi:hypothetical protein AHAS_Ahas04G0078600 [Arachis hypogaea]
MRCTLFREYVDQVNLFLGSGYVEQLVVVLQLAKVKVFRGQVGLQNVTHATKILFNPDIPEVLEFKKVVSMIEQDIYGTQLLFIANEGKIVSLEDDFMRLTRRCTIEDFQDNNEEGCFVVFGVIRAIVEEGPWWYSACVCGKSIQSEGGIYYCDFCMHHVTNVTPRFRIKITVEDEIAHGIFVLFDREAFYLIKRSCAEVQKDASIDTKLVGVDKYFGTFWVKRVCDDAAIIAMFELPNYDANDEINPKKEEELVKPVIVGKDSAHVKEELPIVFEKKLQTYGECSNTKNGSPLLIDSIGKKEDEVIWLDDICADVDTVKAK